MRPLRSSFLCVLALVAPLFAACGSESDALPDLTKTQCEEPTDCPNIVCACASGIVNSRYCSNYYCANQTATCAWACEDKGGTNKDAGTSDARDASADTGVVATAAKGDPCVPVSVSGSVPRVGALAARVLSHEATPPTPANGSVNVSRNTQGKPTYISYDASGSSA